MSADIRARLSLTLTLLLSVGTAQAGVERLGTSSGVFLRLARTAREAALGGCGTGASGASALGNNPAAMGERPGVVASRNEATGGEISVDYVAAARRLGPRSAGGISLLHASGGEIQQTDDAGQSVGGFTPRDIAATLGAASEFGALSAGFSMSYLYSKIIHVAHAVTAGAGAEWRSSNHQTRAGLYASNIAGRLQYVDDKESLPREIRLGVRREIGMAGVVIEGVSRRDDIPYVAGGVEANFKQRIWSFALRAGFDGSRARSRDGASGLCAGAGIAGLGWSLDYSWTPGGDIGDDHLFTLGIRFKPSVSSAPRGRIPHREK